MAKMRWEKARSTECDPGSVVSVPDTVKPVKWTSPDERARQERQRAKEKAELLLRSEMLRLKSIVKKYGPEIALRMGVSRHIAEDPILLNGGKKKKIKMQLY